MWSSTCPAQSVPEEQLIVVLSPAQVGCVTTRERGIADKVWSQSRGG